MENYNFHSITQKCVKKEVVLGKTTKTLVTQNADTNATILPRFLSVVFGQKFGHLIIAYREDGHEDVKDCQYWRNRECSKFQDPITGDFIGGQTFGFFHLDKETAVNHDFISEQMSSISGNKELVEFYTRELSNLKEEDYEMLRNKHHLVKKLADKTGYVNIYDFPEVMEFGDIVILYSVSLMALYISTIDNVEIRKTFELESRHFVLKKIDSYDLFFSKTSYLLSNPTFYNRCLNLLKNLTNEDLAEIHNGKLLYYEGDKFVEKSRRLRINPGTISVGKLLEIERIGEFDRNYMIADVDELTEVLDRHDF